MIGSLFHKAGFVWTLWLRICLLSFLAFALPAYSENEDTSGLTIDKASVTQHDDESQMVKLAKLLVNYSVALQKGEKILLIAENDNAFPLTRTIIEEVYRVGGQPFVDILDERVERALYLGTTAERYEQMLAWDSLKYGAMDARILIKGTENASEYSDVPEEKKKLKSIYWDQVIKDRFMPDRWCALRVPSSGMAQLAGMSTEAFTDFYYRICTIDYSKLYEAMEPLVRLMAATDKVRIVSPGTDLTFSIKSIPAVKSAGFGNIPDGELFTAPVKYSVNGVLTVNQPSEWLGVTYQDIRMEFKDGRIIKASANDSDRFNQVLDSDEGARYLGEFSFGLNPYIERPINITLFDEKICMSFHVAIGNSFPYASNGNKSAVHWDVISIQTPEFGGGEIWFDGRLIRKDGLFVLPELLGLNPENLK